MPATAGNLRRAGSCGTMNRSTPTPAATQAPRVPDTTMPTGGEDGDATGENSSIATHRLVHGEDQRRKQHGCKLGRVLTLDCANSGSGHPPPR